MDGDAAHAVPVRSCWQGQQRAGNPGNVWAERNPSTWKAMGGAGQHDPAAAHPFLHQKAAGWLSDAASDCKQKSQSYTVCLSLRPHGEQNAFTRHRGLVGCTAGDQGQRAVCQLDGAGRGAACGGGPRRWGARRPTPDRAALPRSPNAATSVWARVRRLGHRGDSRDLRAGRRQILQLVHAHLTEAAAARDGAQNKEDHAGSDGGIPAWRARAPLCAA